MRDDLTRLLVGAALVVAGATACSGGRADTSPTAETAAPTTTEVAEPTVTVLDAGAEPRRPLRIAYRPGDVAVVDLTIDQAIDQTVRTDGVDGERAQRFDSPPITHRLAYEVESVDHGTATFTVEITQARAETDGTELDAEAALRLQAELQPMVGVSGRGRVDERGTVEGFAVDLPDDVDPALAERIAALDAQLRSVGPSLPNAPVGVGARWEVVAEASVAGTLQRSTTTYTLTERTDDAFAYEATLTGDAPSQPFALDGVDDAVLEASTSTGAADGTQSLTGLAFTVRTDVSTTQQLRLGDATVDQVVETDVAARPAAP